MRFFKTLFWLTLGIILITGSASAQYYYSDDRQVPLLIDSSKITVAFIYEVQPDTIWSFADNYSRIDSLIEGVENIDDFQTFAINSSNGYAAFIDTLSNNASVRRVIPYYMYEPGEKLLIGEEFYCKFHDATSYAFIDSLNAASGVVVVYEKYYAPKEYLLQIDSNATMSTLDMANYYYELSEVEYSHPDFLGGLIMDGMGIYDYYWDNQWAMQRVFEASDTNPQITAFEITSGNPNIVVAVLDYGIAAHEDIPASRLLQGYDFCCGDDTPIPCDSPGYSYHGMACAGILGAGYTVDSNSQNDPNTGVCGVAPNCKILPIKIMSDYFEEYSECCPSVTASVAARAIDTAWIMGADILSNSWHLQIPVDAVYEATIRAADLGRGGKGCGIFHSSGNKGNGSAGYPNNLDKVISVGAIDPDDKIWSYSNYGKIDVVAPGGSSTPHEDRIWTTDQMGELGGNRTGDDYDCGSGDDVDYLCSFNGTSSAQPVAAGVGALLLSRRPDLTSAQLREVIRNSADPEMYISITDPPHLKYGYGMVHPLRALLAITRGDVNNDAAINVGDAVYLVQTVFNNGPEALPDPRNGDANCDGNVDAGDAVYLINYALKGGPPPEMPCFEY